MVFKWRTRDRSPRRKRRAALAATIAYLSANHSGTYGSPRMGPVRHELAGIEEHRRDVDGRGGCGGSPKTPAARYGHTGQVRPQGARRAAPRFHPGRSGRTCPVRGSHRNPHRRRQTPLATVLDLYLRRSIPIPEHWMVHCVQPTLSVECLRRSSAVSLRIQWSTWWCRPPTMSGLAPTTVLADGCEAGGCQCVVGRVKEHQTELAHLNFVAVG